jgi:hypothetical protein
MAMSPNVVGQLGVGQPFFGQPGVQPGGGQQPAGQQGGVQPNAAQLGGGQPNVAQPVGGQAPGAAPQPAGTYGNWVDPNGAGFTRYSSVLGCWYAWSSLYPWGYRILSVPPGSFAQWLGLQTGDTIYFISGSYANPNIGLDAQLAYSPAPHFMWVIDINTGVSVWMYY